MSTYLRIMKYVLKYKFRFFVACFCVLASGGFMLVGPKIVGWAINYGINPDNERHVAYLTLAALSVFAAAGLRSIAQFGRQYLGQWLGQRIAYDLRNDIYDRLQRLSFAYHDSHQTGQLMSRATQDVEAMQTFIQMGILQAVYFLLIMVGASVLMFIGNWRLSLITLPFLIIVAVSSGVFSSILRNIWNRVQNGLARLTIVMQENMTGARVVRSFGREDLEIKKFDKEAEMLFKDSFAATNLQSFSAPALAGIWMIGMALTIWFGAREITAGRMLPGDLATFALYLTTLQMPVRGLGMTVNNMARAYPAGKRAFELLDAESAVKESSNAVELKNVAGHVVFENVSFGYSKTNPVLKNINIDARPGQVIALLGPPGSGKTTIVNLLPRFYDVTEGRITVDGMDVRDCTLASLRQSMTMVQQDIFLFTGTVKDNISYGAPNASQAEIEHAAKTANIHDFIVGLPQGYDTFVGERGLTLSGGQKQRIAIARTLLLNPAILILDDSTSSVDTETEYSIQQALLQVMKGRTSFVIAQRLRTIKMADEIIVLNRGEVVERGRHDDLVQKNGFYRRIYDLQLRDQEEAMKTTPSDVMTKQLPSTASD
jgi:ABC-type multidrug transport system fused ATPase/permease subunit